jgi:hypothetical protein
LVPAVPGAGNVRAGKLLQTVEGALERRSVEIVQRETESSHAAAVASLLGTLSDIPSAVLAVGTFVIVKTTNSEGDSTIVARTLSTAEASELTSTPGLMKDPKAVMAWLNRSSQQSNQDEPGAEVGLEGRT